MKWFWLKYYALRLVVQVLFVAVALALAFILLVAYYAILLHFGVD